MVSLFSLSLHPHSSQVSAYRFHNPKIRTPPFHRCSHLASCPPLAPRSLPPVAATPYCWTPAHLSVPYSGCALLLLGYPAPTWLLILRPTANVTSTMILFVLTKILHRLTARPSYCHPKLGAALRQWQQQQVHLVIRSLVGYWRLALKGVLAFLGTN